MKNAVIYEKGLDCFRFSRGGVDRDKNPIDPYGRMGAFDLRGRYTGYFIIAAEHDEIEALFDFLGVDVDKMKEIGNPSEKYLVWEDAFKVVFDAHGNPILYRASDKDPVRVSKVCVKKDKFYNEWGKLDSWPSKHNPVEIRGWDFGKVKHIRMYNCNVKDLQNLVPELFGAEPYAFIKPEFEDGCSCRWDVIKKVYEYLYALDPIDLSKPYDYTADEHKVLAEKERKADEKKREMERLKHLPGHCNVCGCDGARWREEFDKYMCDECYEWYLEFYLNSDDE